MYMAGLARAFIGFIVVAGCGSESAGSGKLIAERVEPRQALLNAMIAPYPSADAERAAIIAAANVPTPCDVSWCGEAREVLGRWLASAPGLKVIEPVRCSVIGCWIVVAAGSPGALGTAIEQVQRGTEARWSSPSFLGGPSGVTQAESLWVLVSPT